MMYARLAALLVALAALAACREVSPADAAQIRDVQQTRRQQFQLRLAKADANPNQPIEIAKWLMPEALKEISGLALKSDGTLLAHDDNVGKIFVIDPKTGVVLKAFSLGKDVKGDFEGITTAGSDIYLLQSKGKIYQFREGANGATVPYNVSDTQLGHECEFEGIAYEPDSAWLVMPCKDASGKKMKNQLVIYRWRLQGADSTRLTMMTIPHSLLGLRGKSKDFRPTDITIDPATRNYVMISSRDNALVEITPGGQVVRAVKIPGVHNQAEGVAITKDNILIVSDEENRAPAAITLYRWRP
jgi:uncharacterized protein YjiK